MSRRFTVELSTVVSIEVEDAVIDAVTDEWRSMFYNLRTPKEIAEHLAYNLVVNDAKLSMLDGWADQPNDNIKLLHSVEWESNAISEVVG